jgi:hypothetical protein
VNTVTLAFPDGQRQDVLLAGVPRKDDHIRLSNGMLTPALVVEHVLWQEGRGPLPKPTIIVVVRPHPGP